MYVAQGKSATAATTPTNNNYGPKAIVRYLKRLKRAFRSKKFIFGTAILTFFILVAIIGPVFATNPNGFVGPDMAAPSLKFPLGTDFAGQNVLYQLIDATGPSLLVGFEAGALATLVSVVIGISSGLIGGIFDEASTLFTNIVLVIPSLPLVIIVAAYAGSSGLTPTILVIAFTSWAAYARVLRGQTLSIRNRDFILASRISGEKLWRIVFMEILPNELAIIASNFIFMVVFAILTQATLAFLGIGDVSSLTWGNMLYLANNDEALTSGAWWWFIPPGICIALVGTALAFINFGLDEILNPRLKIARRKDRHPK